MAAALPSPSVPRELRARAASWETLKRWERRELGRALRALGLSYGEIAETIPVSKGTLSAWCSDVVLSEAARARLSAKRPRAEAMQRNGERRRQIAADRRGAIRAAAREEASRMAQDPFWVAGVIAYWSEGSKTGNDLRFANSDVGLILLFVRWTKAFLGIEEFTAKLNLHDGQDERACVAYWSNHTGISADDFSKSYIKPEGSGHRKRILYYGTLLVRPRRSTAALQRVLGWIDGLRAIEVAI